ncbi:MAG: hypothetical protein ACSHXL_03720 [Bacteroidota bacterium]
MKQLKLLLVLTLLLCSSLTKPNYKKGCSGTYFIIGTASSSDKKIIKNDSLFVTFRNETTLVKTDKTGQFEIPISWATTCPSGKTPMERRFDNKQLNPKFISIKYHGQHIKLENQWSKYAQCFPENKEAVTWKKDLEF